MATIGLVNPAFFSGANFGNCLCRRQLLGIHVNKYTMRSQTRHIYKRTGTGIKLKCKTRRL